MMTSVLEEFRKEHGKPIRTGFATYLAPDSATASNGGGMWVITPPSGDAKYRAQAVRKYHRLRAEMAEEDLAKLEAALRPWVPGCPAAPPFGWDEKAWGPDPGDPKMAVILLRAIASYSRKKVAELDAQIGPPIFA